MGLNLFFILCGNITPGYRKIYKCAIAYNTVVMQMAMHEINEYLKERYGFTSRRKYYANEKNAVLSFPVRTLLSKIKYKYLGVKSNEYNELLDSHVIVHEYDIGVVTEYMGHKIVFDDGTYKFIEYV